MRKAIETCFRWLFRYLFSDCGRVFAVQAVWCACTAQAVHPVRAESFSLNLSGELPSADGRRVAVPTAVGKRVDTCGFYPLNSRFPLFLSLAQTRDRRPLRNRGTAVGLPVCRGAHCASITRPIRGSRIPYCYTEGLVCAGAAYLCRATRWSGGYGRRLRVLFDNECYRGVR